MSESYRDNFEMITNYFGGKRLLSIRAVAEFLKCDPHVLCKDKRFVNMLIDFGKQKRISTASLARWMSE